MQGYKNSDDASATEYLNDIKYIAFDALRIHYDCIASCTGAPPTAWATIPSTKSSPNYGKPNPLNAVIAQAMAPNGIPQLRLEATTTKTHNTINPRTFNLTNTAPPPIQPKSTQSVSVFWVEFFCALMTPCSAIASAAELSVTMELSST